MDWHKELKLGSWALAGGAVALAFGSVNFYDFWSSDTEAHLGFWWWIGHIVLLALFFFALSICIAWLVNQRLWTINDAFVSAAKELIEKSAQAIVDELKLAASNVSASARVSQTTSDALRQATADLTALRDSILSQNDWFYPYDRFARRETEICDTASKDGRTVHIVIVSSSLKFDTDATLLPFVSENIRRGANYVYIIPKHVIDIAERKASLRRLADKTIKRADSIRFIELDQDDEIFFFEYAIFYFERPHESVKDHVVTDYEAYVALDTAVKVTSVPWMLLRKPTRELLWSKVSAHLQTSESAGGPSTEAVH